MTILNEEYYQTLWNKYEHINTLNIPDSNTACLSIKFILAFYRKNQPIHINFQNSKETILEIGKQLFIEFANDIFLNHYDLPFLKLGIKLRDKRQYKDGKKHDYVIKHIVNGNYTIESTKGRNKAELNLNYDSLVKKFIPIKKGSRQLKGYTKYFYDLNGGIEIDFTPTNFEKKTVFIAKKPLWDALPDKNKIPCAYLPNPREESYTSTIKSIPALQDCLAFFTPKYEVCYQQILLKEEKIKTVIVFDTEADKIEQILQDKARFGFNLIVMSNSYSPLKNEIISCWNWFKEEIKIVDAL
ncbi:MAG: hypothetical protein GKR88_12530 [Flavobacteriaceae bacterium]|nr:MAG: hypothetical protein GKR88_12530 [Flavobacteriaceae bacterium]